MSLSRVYYSDGWEMNHEVYDNEWRYIFEFSSETNKWHIHAHKTWWDAANFQPAREHAFSSIQQSWAEYVEGKDAEVRGLREHIANLRMHAERDMLELERLHRKLNQISDLITLP